MREAYRAGKLAVPAYAAAAGQVDRLYMIDCGWAHAADQSRWSPGVNVGAPIDFSDNCYLIHHTGEGDLLWDTGITDRLVALPDGITVAALNQTWLDRPAFCPRIGVNRGNSQRSSRAIICPAS